MARKVTVLLADFNDFFPRFLAKRLEADPILELVGTATSPSQLYAAIADLRPDFIILEMSVNRFNTWQVLVELREVLLRERLPTEIFALVNCPAGEYLGVLRNADVAHCLLKPFTHLDLIAALKDFILCQARNQIDRAVPTALLQANTLLGELYIPPSDKGYGLLRRALLLLLDRPYMEKGITKNLYPTLAREFATTSACVERNIRRSISQAHGCCPREIWGRYFAPDSQDRPPTNRRFLLVLCQVLRDRQGSANYP